MYWPNLHENLEEVSHTPVLSGTLYAPVLSGVYIHPIESSDVPKKGKRVSSDDIFTKIVEDYFCEPIAEPDPPSKFKDKVLTNFKIILSKKRIRHTSDCLELMRQISDDDLNDFISRFLNKKLKKGVKKELQSYEKKAGKYAYLW